MPHRPRLHGAILSTSAVLQACNNRSTATTATNPSEQLYLSLEVVSSDCVDNFLPIHQSPVQDKKQALLPNSDADFLTTSTSRKTVYHLGPKQSAGFTGRVNIGCVAFSSCMLPSASPHLKQLRTCKTMLQLPRVGVCELLHSRAVVLSWHTKSAVTASNSTLWFETTCQKPHPPFGSAVCFCQAVRSSRVVDRTPHGYHQNAHALRRSIGAPWEAD